ncbi:DivIVA domain-containing protein [Micromonospora sp. WMMD1082]|uniref:DivIVA domain-containing protein n=1 Tax=Micromonospora sp. WMMD1082 TaxID=3016104 RepID=UPI002416A0BF|nr:DivIVA domain-containing protein [Micromonospora sp. WMMD1082]MDG4793583.1 DivIVA domain-containing protein [Micromonospora sp. WMMD1082]
MGQLLLLLVVAVTVAAVVFGVTVLVTGRDPGLVPAEADGRAVPLPGDRPLRESDVGEVRFDTALRGYRMTQVDQAMRRAAYDIGYKTELIGVLEAEVAALREGRTSEADALRRAREQSAGAATVPTGGVGTTAEAGGTDAAGVPAGAAEPTAAAATEPEVAVAEPDTAVAEPDAAVAEPDTAVAEPAGSNGQAGGDEPADAGPPEAGPRGPVVRSESA